MKKYSYNNNTDENDIFENKQNLSKEIAEATEAFLAKGGKIKNFPPGVSSEYKSPLPEGNPRKRKKNKEDKINAFFQKHLES